MRVFVTGGAGFIGSHYVDFLLESEGSLSKVTIYDALTYAGDVNNLVESISDSRVQLIHANILDYLDLKEAIKGHDVVVHFAAESHVDNSIQNSDLFVQTNIVGTRNLLQAALDNGVEKFIHVSTDEVYGSITDGFADEQFPLKPSSPYASSKAGSDLIALSFHKTYGLDVRVTRSCNNFGARQHPEKLIPKIIKRALGGESIPIYGDGTNIREWIHVSDNVKAIHLVLKSGLPGEIYNIGSSVFLNNLELAILILGILNVGKDRIEFVEDRKGHDLRYALNTSKISELGLADCLEFKDALSSSIEWYRNQHTSFFQKLPLQ